MPANVADRNRKIRQDALRAQLAEQCRVQHVLDNIHKIEERGAEMEPQELNAIKIANEQRLKLINKYLPDLKATEISGEGGGPVILNMTDWSDSQIDEYINKHSK